MRSQEYPHVVALCGLTFSSEESVDVDSHEPVSCPLCAQHLGVIPVVPAVPDPDPVTHVWRGPKVEVLIETRPGGSPEPVVFVDGRRVPDQELRYHVVDPGAGHMRSDWEATTDDVMGDTRLSRPFRDAVLSARDVALEFDEGRYIVNDSDGLED